MLYHKSGVDIEKKTNNGCTPLLHALGNCHSEVVDLLLHNNADLAAKDNDGINTVFTNCNKDIKGFTIATKNYAFAEFELYLICQEGFLLLKIVSAF